MKALPLVTIQPDLPDVVSDVLSGAVGAEQCWISCYKHGLPSIHAKALLTANDDDSAVRYESLDERVHVAAAGQRSLTVSCAALGLPAQLVSFPSSSTSVTSTGIDVLAVAPDRSSIAVASRSAIRILDGHTLAPKLSLQGHIGDVRSMRFVSLLHLTHARLSRAHAVPAVSFLRGLAHRRERCQSACL